VRDLRGVVERESAAIGVLITMQEPTSHMRTEAAAAGFYDSPWGGSYPRLQILTVAQLLAGQRIDYPQRRGHGSDVQEGAEGAAARRRAP
jgi:site-specific DNA-methyltransferase (adenine-specific)